MSRSPSQMTTTAPVAKAKTRATKCLGPPSRYESSGEPRHSNLLRTHSRKVFQVITKPSQSHFTLPCAKFNYKVPQVAEPEVLCSKANCMLQCPTGDRSFGELRSVQPTDLYAAVLAWTSCQSCCVALETHPCATALGLVPPANASSPR